MSEFIVSQNPEILDPELLALARHISHEMILTAEKVAAHIAEPDAFPIPEDAELETLLLERLRSLSAERQRNAGAKALQFFRGPAQVRAALVGDLADLDVSKASPVSELVRARPAPSVRLTAQTLEQAFSRGPSPAQVPRKKPIQPSNANEWLELRLHHVKCIDETDGFLGSEAGSDEINVGVVLMDAIQRTTKTPIYDLGSYASDGAERAYSPPLVLGGWDLRAGFYWPRTVTAVVYLCEVDNGGFPAWLQKVFEFAKSKVASAVTSAIGAAIGGLLGAGIGAVVGALVGWVVGELISALKTWWEDDVFPPATLTVNHVAENATFGGQTTSHQFPLHFQGHGGEYRLTADLRITARPAGQTSSGLTTGAIEDVVTDVGGIACGLTVEAASPTKIRNPLTGEVTATVTMAVSVERPLVFALGRGDGSMMFRDLSSSNTQWISLGGAFTSGPAVALTGPTRPVVFARGTDNAIWHAWRDSSGAPWSGWHSLGGVLTSAPAATMSLGRLVIAARGTDMAIYHKWHENGWSGWHSLGGVSTSAPALVRFDNRLFVFCRGVDGAIYHKWYTNTWSDWHSLGGVSTSAPAAMVDSEGRLVVYCRGIDGAIYHKWHGSGWSAWHSLGGVSHSAPAAMVGSNKQSIVFCRGTDGAIYERHWAGAWTPWAGLGVP
jgi:hypothetical protein